MGPTKFFEYLGAPLKNSRWSWGAVRSDGGVFLRTWKDEVRTLGDDTHYLIFNEQPASKGKANLGCNERRRHIDSVIAGAPCFLVMCSAEDVDAHPRRIESFDEKNLIVGGEIVEVEGELWIKADGLASIDAVRTTSARKFGEIENVEVGEKFINRAELAKAGVHPPPVAGISGNKEDGADSIVLSGGYEDDEDLGETIIYTGQGGNESGKQVADQELTRGNKALAISFQRGLPIRVTRGAKHKSQWSPTEGYQYGGLYQVAACWHDRGKSGFKIWRFRLEQIGVSTTQAGDSQSAEPATLNSQGGTSNPSRRKTTTIRVVRDTALSKNLKQYYDYRCQVCDLRLEGPGGAYAEAAHIRPLGRPHNGPDTTDNILCLCPNHHWLFDVGAFGVADDLSLIGMEGNLVSLDGHDIDHEHLNYHRQCICRV